MEKRVKFGLRKKLIVFVVALAIATYSASFIFIEYIQPMFFENTSRQVFEIICFYEMFAISKKYVIIWQHLE